MIQPLEYKVEIDNITEQMALQWLRLCCTLYNLALEQRIWVYQHRKKNLGRFDQTNELPDFKKAFPEFNQVFSVTLLNVVLKVNNQWTNFIKYNRKLPDYIAEKDFNSFTVNYLGFRLKGNKLRVYKLGIFKLLNFQPIEHKIKKVIIKKTDNGEWTASVFCRDLILKTETPSKKPVYKELIPEIQEQFDTIIYKRSNQKITVKIDRSIQNDIDIKIFYNEQKDIVIQTSVATG